MFKRITLILLTVCVFVGTALSQTIYDPPSSYTTHYRLRMWDNGDHPGADSVNQNLKDIDYQLYQVNLKADRVYTEGHIYSGANTFSSNTNSYNGSEYKLSGTNINTSGTLTNVAYLNANNVFLGHQEFADHFTITADDATSYINFTGTDNCLLKFNGNTFVTWTGAQFTIPGTISATEYKTGNTAGYLASGYGVQTSSGLYLANETGGETNYQLNYVTLSINGKSYKLLIVPE